MPPPPTLLPPPTLQSRSSSMSSNAPSFNRSSSEAGIHKGGEAVEMADTSKTDKVGLAAAASPPPTPAGGGKDVSIAVPAAAVSLDVHDETPVELFYHRWDDAWLLRFFFARYQAFYCIPDKDAVMRVKHKHKKQQQQATNDEKPQSDQPEYDTVKANFITSSRIDQQYSWTPHAILRDMQCTRRHITQTRLAVDAIIYILSLVLTMAVGVVGACIVPSANNNTIIGVVTVACGVVTGIFNAISSVYESWEQEVITAQHLLSTKYTDIPTPYSASPFHLGTFSAPAGTFNKPKAAKQAA